MGCGCNSGGQRNAGRRPVVTPRNRSVQGGTALVRTTNQLRAQQIQQARSGQDSNRLTAARRELERKRRNEIVRRKFGK